MQRGAQQLNLVERSVASAPADSRARADSRAHARPARAPRAGAPDTTPSRARGPWLRRSVWAVAVLGGLAALTAAVVAFVLPIDTYRAQRVRIDTYERTAEQLEATREQLESELATAQSPVAVERAARAQQSLVRPGDTQYYLSVDLRAVIQLPPSWPLPGLRHLLEP